MIEQILSVCLGVGLGAACGFRVFVPLLLINLAARTGYLTLSGNFEWLAGNPALITLLVASLLEVIAYYVPWLDNVLDVIAGPAAAIAGTVARRRVLECLTDRSSESQCSEQELLKTALLVHTTEGLLPA